MCSFAYQGHCTNTECEYWFDKKIEHKSLNVVNKHNEECGYEKD